MITRNKREGNLLVKSIFVFCAFFGTYVFSLAQAPAQAPEPPVVLESCVPSEKNNPLKPVLGEIAIFHCQLINNGNDQAPVFIVAKRKNTDTKENFSLVSGSFVSLKPHESTTTDVVIGAVFNSGVYVYSLGLSSATAEEKMALEFGKSITFSSERFEYSSIKIVDASFDKKTYKDNDLVTLSLSVNDFKNKNITPYTLEVNTLRKDGSVCSNLFRSGEITKGDGIYTFNFISNPLCKTGELSVSILDSKGTPLATKNVSISPVGGEKEAAQVLDTSINTKVYIVLFGITAIFIAIVTLLFYFIRKQFNLHKK